MILWPTFQVFTSGVCLLDHRCLHSEILTAVWRSIRTIHRAVLLQFWFAESLHLLIQPSHLYFSKNLLWGWGSKQSSEQAQQLPHTQTPSSLFPAKMWREKKLRQNDSTGGFWQSNLSPTCSHVLLDDNELYKTAISRHIVLMRTNVIHLWITTFRLFRATQNKM